MRWRNEAEKRLVLEAAAEYSARMKDIASVFKEGREYVLTDMQHFEEWLRWYFTEGLHTANVSAYMQAIPKTVYEQRPSLAEKQQKDTTHGIAYGGILDKLRNKTLPKAMYAAAIRALEDKGWKLRDGETLLDTLEKISSKDIRQHVVQRVREEE